MYDEIVSLIKDRFPYGVELCHVDYRDSLTDEQAEWYVTGDTDRLFDSILDWECENRWYGADWYIDALTRHIREDSPDFEPGDDWLETVRDTLMELDESDVLGDLVKLTRNKVAVGKWVIVEDDAAWGLHSVGGLIEALGVPDTVANRAVAEELISNAPTDLGMAFSAYQVAPADLHGLPEGRAAIRSQWLPVFYGNPFTGGYHAGAFDLGAPVDVPLTELTPINRMMQWAPSDVYGRFPYELTGETELVEIDN